VTPWETVLPALAGLLVVAGGAKLLRPADLTRALRAAGLPVPPGPVGDAVVRAGAALEVLIGGWALLAGGRVGMGGLVVSYAGFAGFVAVALLRGTPLATCGCFGEPDTPPTPAHALVCAAGAVVAAVALTSPPRGLLSIASGLGAWRGIGLGVLVTTAAYAAYLVMAAVPKVTVARRDLRGEQRCRR